MKTIVINSQKGRQRQDDAVRPPGCSEPKFPATGPAFLIDTDPQGTLSTWHEKREAEVPQRAEVALANIEQGLELLKKHGAAYCFIDTAPTRTDENVALCSAWPILSWCRSVQARQICGRLPQRSHC